MATVTFAIERKQDGSVRGNVVAWEDKARKNGRHLATITLEPARFLREDQALLDHAVLHFQALLADYAEPWEAS